MSINNELDKEIEKTLRMKSAFPLLIAFGVAIAFMGMVIFHIYVFQQTELTGFDDPEFSVFIDLIVSYRDTIRSIMISSSAFTIVLMMVVITQSLMIRRFRKLVLLFTEERNSRLNR